MTGEVSTLVVSMNRGRYALDDAMCGYDLTCGDCIAVLLGGQWVEGRVEHAPDLYAVQRPEPVSGYYFISRDGGMCGLCVGMKVCSL